MKKMTLLLALVLSLSAQAGPRVVGNGGGGIYENGIYKTFYSAGVLVNPREARDIPGLSLLHETVLSMTSNVNLFPAYLPSGDRKYFNIIESETNQKNIERLFEEYRRVVGQGNNIAIFAITDIPTKTTYLMPAFYELTEVEQAAILFHEAYWLINPTATYHEVVNAEIAFQEFVEGKQKGVYYSEFPRLLGKLVGESYISFRAAMRFDIENNTAPNLITKDGIRVLNLYSKCEWQLTFYKQSGKFKREYYSIAGASGLVYRDFFTCEDVGKRAGQVRFLELQKKYPKSQFVNELLNRALISNGQIFGKGNFGEGEDLALKLIGSMKIDGADMSRKELEIFSKKLDQVIDSYRVRFY